MSSSTSVQFRQARELLGLDPLADADAVEAASARAASRRAIDGEPTEAVERARNILLQMLLELPERVEFDAPDTPSEPEREPNLPVSKPLHGRLVAWSMTLLGLLALFRIPSLDRTARETGDERFMIALFCGVLLLGLGAWMQNKARGARPPLVDWAALFFGLEGGALLGCALYQPQPVEYRIWFPIMVFVCWLAGAMNIFARDEEPSAR